jgi:5-methylcytosine-specific restriction endonuclease McrA
MSWQRHTPRRKPTDWPLIRKAVLDRDMGMCRYCGAAATEVDHILPVSRGGGSHMANLQALCRRCHATKTARVDSKPTQRRQRPRERHPGEIH